MHVIIAIRVILIHFDPVMTDSFVRAWRDVEPEEQKDDEWVDACTFFWGRLQLLDRRRRGRAEGMHKHPSQSLVVSAQGGSEAETAQTGRQVSTLQGLAQDRPQEQY